MQIETGAQLQRQQQKMGTDFLLFFAIKRYNRCNVIMVARYAIMYCTYIYSEYTVAMIYPGVGRKSDTDVYCVKSTVNVSVGTSIRITCMKEDANLKW